MNGTLLIWIRVSAVKVLYFLLKAYVWSSLETYLLSNYSFYAQIPQKILLYQIGPTLL